MDLVVGQIVIVRSNVSMGWCLAESMDGFKGFTPLSHLTPYLPSAEYIPKWKLLLLKQRDSSTCSVIESNLSPDPTPVQQEARLLSRSVKSSLPSLSFLFPSFTSSSPTLYASFSLDARDESVCTSENRSHHLPC